MNNQNSTFETLKFNPYDSENLLLDNNSDPDENFFKESYFTDTKYFSAEEAKLKLSCSKSNSFSLLHLNIRSLQKNFDKLIDFLATLDFEFKVACISETWCSENVGVGGSKVISRIHVAIVFLEIIHHKTKETAKKINYCIFHGLPGKIRGNDQIWVKKLKKLNLLVIRACYIPF